MIIKTAESRNLGGKYIDSADSVSKIECLHLCCETESCDVFVYEEKVCLSVSFCIVMDLVYLSIKSRLIIYFLFHRVKVNVFYSIVGHHKIFDANFPNIQIIRALFYHWIKNYQHHRLLSVKKRAIHQMPLYRCHRMKSN